MLTIHKTESHTTQRTVLCTKDGPLCFKVKIEPHIYEKVVRSKDGRLFLVRFVVSESNGILRGRILSVAPVPELNSEPFVTIYRNRHNFYHTPRFLISTSKKETVFQPAQDIYSGIVSPFFSPLEFFTSQMTRAPSGKGMANRV